MMYIVFSSNAFCQCMHSLRIKRMTLVMLACCTSWTTLAGFEIYVVTYNAYYFKAVFSKQYVYIAFWKLCSTQWYSTWRLYYVSVSIFSTIKPLMVSSVSVSSDVTFFLLDTVHIRKIPLSNHAMDVKAHEWRSANASLSFICHNRPSESQCEEPKVPASICSCEWIETALQTNQAGFCWSLCLPVWLSIRQKSDL